MVDRKLPKFANEDEEAQWWYDHREEIGRDFERAAADGTLGEGSVARRLRKMRALQDAAQAPELSGLRAK